MLTGDPASSSVGNVPGDDQVSSYGSMAPSDLLEICVVAGVPYWDTGRGLRFNEGILWKS